MASNFYRKKDKPHYVLGHALEIGFIVGGIIAAGVLVVSYSAINKKRAKALREGAGRDHTPLELSEQGDRAVTFRYMF